MSRDLTTASNGSSEVNVAIRAETDADAVALWINAKGSRSKHTFDAYRREAGRLLIWLNQEGLTLSSMRVEDVHRFFRLLANPPAHWIRPRKLKRGESILSTQVLFGPLSHHSIAHTRAILGQMFLYLQDAGYLNRNVFRLSASPPVIHETTPGRLLDLDAWRWLWSWLKNLPDDDERKAAKANRLRWIFALFYHTGIRLNEAAHARMSDFIRRDGFWQLQVVGKGQKKRWVSVNSALLRELVKYRESLGMLSFPTPNEQVPLIGPVNRLERVQPMTPRSIRLLVSQAAQQAAQACADEHIQAILGQISPHWLRHTSATHRLHAGASLETIQDELGHADPKTTRLYAKVSSKKHKDDAEKLARLIEEE